MATAAVATTAHFPIAATTAAAANGVPNTEVHCSRLAARRLDNDNTGDDTPNVGGVCT